MSVISFVAAIPGAVLGFVYFRALRLNVQLYVNGGALWLPLALHVGRIAAAVLVFGLLTPFGAGALLGALAGFMAARLVLVRPERRRA
jgi:hypothetical protein